MLRVCCQREDASSSWGLFLPLVSCLHLSFPFVKNGRGDITISAATTNYVFNFKRVCDTCFLSNPLLGSRGWKGMDVWRMTDKVWPKSKSYAGAELGNSPRKPTDAGSQLCFLFFLSFYSSLVGLRQSILFHFFRKQILFCCCCLVMVQMYSATSQEMIMRLGLCSPGSVTWLNNGSVTNRTAICKKYYI